MFEESFRGIADLVLPGTSYLERDGTTINLEGRLQRQRRAVLAPVPDVLAWLSKLAERFDVELSPHASNVFDEISERCFGGIAFGEVGERAALPPRAERPPAAPPDTAGARRHAACGSSPTGRSSPARPSSARPSCSSSARRARCSSRARTRTARGIRSGQTVTVSSNGTSVELRARIARDLGPGIVRVADADAGGLHADVEVKA